MSNDFQRTVAKLLLEHVSCYGFALAGGSALVELGLTQRPTRDLDLFTSQLDVSSFNDAVDRSIEVLGSSGYSVRAALQTETFARFTVTDGTDTIIVELGYDYREYEPNRLSVGPVLDERDAILNKISALYARTLPRDYIDVYNIRKSGRMSDDILLTLSSERDEGFVFEYFVEALRRIAHSSYEEYSEYGTTRQEYESIKQSIVAWAEEIQQSLG